MSLTPHGFIFKCPWRANASEIIGANSAHKISHNRKENKHKDENPFCSHVSERIV